MEGPTCKRLLDQADILETDLPRHLKKFARTMTLFNVVVKSCFENELDPNFLIHIERFRKSYMSLGVRITPKVHVVFQHVGEFCKRKSEGLSKYAEQASESVHYDFYNVWKCFKCHETHQDYADKLCSCVVRYNSMHVEPDKERPLRRKVKKSLRQANT